jgi:hypothetical protein
MNPLYDALVATKQGQIPMPAPQMQNNSNQDWNTNMGQLQANPIGMLTKAGYSVPEELAGNPQAMVMHLMQSGQIGGPMMQKIQPFLQRMGFR